MHQHKPEEHALVPVVEPRVERVGSQRRHRPPSHYRCSCGTILPGNSRRQAKPAHLLHRQPFAGKGARG